MCRTVAAARTPSSRSLATRPLAGDRIGVSELGTLVKIHHGLLGSTVGGDRDEMDASEWTVHADDNIVNSGSVVGSDKRVSFIPGDVEDKWAIATWDPLGEIAGEIMVYSILSTHETEPEIDSVIWAGLAAMMDPADYTELNFVNIHSKYRVPEPPDGVGDNLLTVTEFGVAGQNRTLATLDRDIGQRAFQILWTRDDGEAAAFDGYAAQEDPSLLTHSGHGRSSGMVGLMTRGSTGTTTSQRCWCFALWAVSGRWLTVLDAPAGSRAVVLDSAGEELASESEAGGEIAVDMMLLGDQEWSIDPATLLPDTPWPDEAVTLRVEDANGTPLAVLTPTGIHEGVWGGDIYSFSEC